MRAPSLITVLLLAAAAGADERYPWLERRPDPAQSFEARFAPPDGFTRPPCDGLCGWLRRLPLKPGRPPVHLFDGSLKGNQAAQVAVVDVDVGRRDLQQCADAVMRLWSEYRFAAGTADGLCIPLTSGAPLPWIRWARGEVPRVAGAKLEWERRGPENRSHAAFRRYLDFAFTYAGTASMERAMVTRVRMSELQPGDVFVQGGFPGHAVIVIDVAHGPAGRRAFALAQSYMPAQELHVLDNPAHPGRPWYELGEGETLRTPEWTFAPGALARLRPQPLGCP